MFYLLKNIAYLFIGDPKYRTGRVMAKQDKLKILIIDTYYQECVDAIYAATPSLARERYRVQLNTLMTHQFGTADFWSQGLIKHGADAIDVIMNVDPLQRSWATEHGMDLRKMGVADIIDAQIGDYGPNVIVFQNLSCLSLDKLTKLKEKYLLVGQLSCGWPGDQVVSRMHLIFTSFPHYVDRIQKCGARAVYMPLAFDPGCAVTRTRDIECSFVGGFGSHWEHMYDIFRSVAAEIPDFKIWGYGAIPPDLRKFYQGPAWGRDMYDIMSRSKITLNRHHRAAEGCANNMRLYEATGCGAMLITEQAPNLERLFVPGREVETYGNKEELVEKIKYYLDNPGKREEVADRGRQRTLLEHTYYSRMGLILNEFVHSDIKSRNLRSI